MLNYSILMTVYKNDNPKFVEASIKSMVDQTKMTDNFVIVCDGPIGDELQKIINTFDNMFPGIFDIHYLKENVGLGAALNYGVTQCKNELIARMDDDDISLKDRCEKELLEFQQNIDISLVGSYVIEFNESTEYDLIEKRVPIEYDDIVKYSKRKNPFNHSTVMFKKSTIMQIGNYSKMRTNQDVELWIRLINNGYKCMNIPKPLVYFRFDSNTLKRRKNWKNTKLMINVWNGFRKNKYCSFFDFLYVFFRQICIFITPMFVLRAVYKRIR